MFKQLTIYRLAEAFALPQSDAIEDDLAAKRYVPIGLSQEESRGFYPPRGSEHDPLIEAIGGHYIMRLNIETKSVPSRTIRQKTAERVAEIEQATGRKPGKKEKRDIMDEVLFSLLPVAFPKLAAVTIWIDPERRLLALNTASQGKCDIVLSALIDAIPDLSVQLIQTTTNPQAAMTQWLLADTPDDWPDNLNIERECVLKSTSEDAATVKFNKHHLANDDVRKHVTEGKLPTQLALSWDGRVSFVLTESMGLKKIQYLDGVMDTDEQHQDRFDADVVLATGLLGPLLDDLVYALGGEFKDSTD
jgi:recombination associated protein RdgC